MTALEPIVVACLRNSKQTYLHGGSGQEVDKKWTWLARAKLEFMKFLNNTKLILNFFCKHDTPGPHLMRIHLVGYSTGVRYEKYSNIHLVQPIIHLVQIFALSE